MTNNSSTYCGELNNITQSLQIAPVQYKFEVDINTQKFKCSGGFLEETFTSNYEINKKTAKQNCAKMILEFYKGHKVDVNIDDIPFCGPTIPEYIFLVDSDSKYKLIDVICTWVHDAKKQAWIYGFEGVSNNSTNNIIYSNKIIKLKIDTGIKDAADHLLTYYTGHIINAIDSIRKITDNKHKHNLKLVLISSDISLKNTVAIVERENKYIEGHFIFDEVSLLNFLHNKK